MNSIFTNCFFNLFGSRASVADGGISAECTFNYFAHILYICTKS